MTRPESVQGPFIRSSESPPHNSHNSRLVVFRRGSPRKSETWSVLCSDTDLPPTVPGWTRNEGANVGVPLGPPVYSFLVGVSSFILVQETPEWYQAYVRSEPKW